MDECLKLVTSTRSRSDAGIASQLSKLFIKVRDRELTPEEATIIAVQKLDPHNLGLPTEAQNDISATLESIQMNPEQMLFDFDISDEPTSNKHPTPRKRKRPPIEQHVVFVMQRDKKRSQPMLSKKYKKS